MMAKALARAFAAPEVGAILIDPLFSNTRAHRFYSRFGFEFEGRRRFDDDDCAVFRLTRAAWRELR